jgi:hypothetical protein
MQCQLLRRQHTRCKQYTISLQYRLLSQRASDCQHSMLSTQLCSEYLSDSEAYTANTLLACILATLVLDL